MSGLSSWIKIHIARKRTISISSSIVQNLGVENIFLNKSVGKMR